MGGDTLRRRLHAARTRSGSGDSRQNSGWSRCSGDSPSGESGFAGGGRSSAGASPCGQGIQPRTHEPDHARQPGDRVYARSPAGQRLEHSRGGGDSTSRSAGNRGGAGRLTGASPCGQGIQPRTPTRQSRSGSLTAACVASFACRPKTWKCARRPPCCSRIRSAHSPKRSRRERRQ